MCSSSSPLFSPGWWRLCVCCQQPSSIGDSSPSYSHSHHSPPQLGEHPSLLHPISMHWSIPRLSDWVLNMIQQGYSSLLADPPLHKCHALVYSSRHQEACTSGCTSESGFSSQYFLFPKKDGGLWAILDLRLLNYAFMNQPFRMLTEFCFVPQYMTEYHVALLFYSCLEIFAFSAMAVEQLTFGHRSRTIQCLKSILSAFCDYLCHSSLSLRCYVHERLMHMTQNWKVSKWSSYTKPYCK